MSAEHAANVSGTGNAAVIGMLLAELEALGVREYCVCAGARNAPLLDVLTRRSPTVTLHGFYEERSAAFFALGRVMQLRAPVAVITTSGTAVAELFPAVMEAYYQALPLVLVTADRPSRYRGSGAPQAVEQAGIFGDYVVREVDIVGGHELHDAPCRTDQSGPIHFNVCLEEGLGGCDSESSAHRASASHIKCSPQSEFTQAQHLAWKDFWAAQGDLVVLASGIHPNDVPVAREFLLKLGAPVVAEFTSNLLSEPALRPLLVRGGENALKQVRAGRVLRIGGVPSWRWWRDLDSRGDVRVLNLSRAPFRGLARSHGVTVVPWEMMKNSVVEVLPEELSTVAPQSEKLASLLASHPHSEPAWMGNLSRLIGPGATVFLGNSMPIREWNLAAELPRPGTRYFANRGANGIDGLVSTWLGVSADADESWLILGDLSALYDLSAPWILPQLKKGKRRIVVINNGGGKIFSRVSWLQHATGETKRFMDNPHSLSFESWARLWGLDYRLLTDGSQLNEDDHSACAIWEVRPEPGQTEAFWAAWHT